MTRPLVVAHRGGSALAPENTLAAFKNAVRLGCEAVELDVLMTRDGHLVAHHDDTLARTAGVPGRVWDLDLADLKRLDVGRWYGADFAGERIATLDEVAGVLPPETRMLADFKHGEEQFPGFAARLAEFARAFGPERFAALSIRHEVAAAVARRAPEALALYTYRAPFATDDELRRLDLPAGAGFAVSMRALSAALLVIARAQGRPVYVFTPNTPGELTVALTVGADAVITDHPDLAIDLRRSLLANR
jgi:glycerophosphoryl diester phosphodiesterase